MYLNLRKTQLLFYILEFKMSQKVVPEVESPVEATEAESVQAETAQNETTVSANNPTFN